MTYEVVVWNSIENGSVARIRIPMATAKGKTKIDWLPVAIHGVSAEEARAKAVSFYESEQERLSNKSASLIAAREKSALTRQAKKGLSA
jgi:hypothetical protein